MNKLFKFKQIRHVSTLTTNQLHSLKGGGGTGNGNGYPPPFGEENGSSNDQGDDNDDA